LRYLLNRRARIDVALESDRAIDQVSGHEPAAVYPSCGALKDPGVAPAGGVA
jgi:hypothetical protein